MNYCVLVVFSGKSSLKTWEKTRSNSVGGGFAF